MFEFFCMYYLFSRNWASFFNADEGEPSFLVGGSGSPLRASAILGAFSINFMECKGIQHVPTIENPGRTFNLGRHHELFPPHFKLVSDFCMSLLVIWKAM